MQSIDSANLELARPARMKVRVEQIGDEIVLVHTPRSWFSAIFILFWLSVWTVGCVSMAAGLVANFNFWSFLFALPFWASWFLVAGVLASILFYREEVRFGEAGVHFRSTILGRQWEDRTIPLAEMSGFEQRDTSTDSDTVTYQLVLNSVGKPLKFGSELSAPERTWLVSLLNAHDAKLRAKLGLAPLAGSGDIDDDEDEFDDENDDFDQADETQVSSIASDYSQTAATDDSDDEENSDDESDASDDTHVIAQLRPPAEVAVSKPDGTTWNRLEDFDAITFSQRGRLTFSGLGMVLLVNIIWNGIVGLFLSILFGFMPGEKGPQGFEWWMLFLFLIPFELVGLILLLAIVGTLAEPIRRTRWILRRDALECRLAWLGIGRKWRYEISELDRLEIRKAGVNQGKKFSNDAASKLVVYSLFFVDANHNEVTSISMLTLAEACWMADTVLRERALWFKRVG